MKVKQINKNKQTKLFNNSTEDENKKLYSAPRSFFALLNNSKKKNVSQAEKPFSTQAISVNSREIKIYSNLIRISKSPSAIVKIKKEEHKRGIITNFSERSRHRMQKLIAMLEVDKLDYPTFNTLTFHNLNAISATKSKYYLAQYCKKIKRLYPNAAWIWRMEYQKRGTIHFHLILFLSTKEKINLNEYQKNQLISFWHSVTCEESKHHLIYGCNFTKIKDFKHLLLYVSKYACKIDSTFQTKSDGRHWGKSQNLPIRPFTVLQVSQKTETQFRRFLKRLWKSKHKKKKYFGNKVNPEFAFTSFIALKTSLTMLNFLITQERKAEFDKSNSKSQQKHNLLINSTHT